MLRFHWWLLISVCAAVVGCNGDRFPEDAADVLEAAQQYPERAGFSEQGSGSLRQISFGGVEILPASTTSHRLGYTFDVVMRVAEKRGLLAGKYVDEVVHFKKLWFHDHPVGYEKGAVVAIETLGIGEEVGPETAQRGDFIQFWRQNMPVKSDGSGIFLEWIRECGIIIGVQYQTSLNIYNGVATAEEHFVSSGKHGSTIDPARFYVARLYRGDRE